MEYKEKIIIRLVFFSITIIVGIALFVVSIFKESDNSLSSFAGAFIGVGILQVIKYVQILKNENKLRDYEIRENDERIIQMDRQANSMTIDIFAIAAMIAEVVLALLDYMYASRIVMYVLCGMIIINMICREIVRRKY